MFVFSRNFNQSTKEKQRALRKLRDKEIHLKYALCRLGENRPSMTENVWERKVNDVVGQIAELQSYENKIIFGELFDSGEIFKLNNMFISTKFLSEISMRLWGEK
ncbi:hypothetical protein [Lysinibacillus fusiformis]|uniref:hypothetical protein n=1 Tax=Lysinibacillus fusiformis TaxID=28031 RepID=UPI00119DD509|nr:hypothetical protein [Lysinibacillus fusiformis]